jgi:hypothetical protein
MAKMQVMVVAEWRWVSAYGMAPTMSWTDLPQDQVTAGILSVAGTSKECVEMAQALGFEPNIAIGIEITAVPDTKPDCPDWLQRTMVISRSIVRQGGKIYVVPVL